MHRDLAGKVAIVTGSATSIGQGIARRLAQEGATVVLVDISDMGETAALCELEGATVLTLDADVTNESDMNKMATTTIERFKKIDILVNNAGGVTGLGIPFRPLEQFVLADWNKIVELNLTGVFLATRAVVPHMKQANYGRIVVISSGAGRSTSRTGIHAYTAAKAGVLGFTRQVARELGPHNVTANAICPGLILSNERLKGEWAQMPREIQSKFLDGVALRRTGEASDIADAVAFLCSDESRYMTGQTLSVDGGHWMF